MDLEILPNRKGTSKSLMWSRLLKTRFLQVLETSRISSARAIGSQMLLFGVDSDYLELGCKEISTLGNSAQ